MQLLKTFFGILVVAFVAAGGVYAAEKKGLLPTKQVEQIQHLIQQAQNIYNRPELQTATSTTRGAVSMLSSKTENVASQAGVVLGEHVQATDNQPPLAQRAFEYARYSYCQEVVKEYVSRNPNPSPIVSASSPTP